jgi:GNAT superfamily N-acetyltransferase
VRLRDATREDVGALSELLQVCDVSQREWAGPGLPIPTREEEELEWELRFARRGAWIHLAQEDDGRVIGVVAFASGTVSREDRTPVPGLAHVSAVFVDPERWRRGIARTLLAAAEKEMRAQGYQHVQLWTLEGSPAERLYRALGWERDGRRDVYPPMAWHVVAYIKAL